MSNGPIYGFQSWVANVKEAEGHLHNAAVEVLNKLRDDGMTLGDIGENVGEYRKGGKPFSRGYVHGIVAGTSAPGAGFMTALSAYLDTLLPAPPEEEEEDAEANPEQEAPQEPEPEPEPEEDVEPETDDEDWPF